MPEVVKMEPICTLGVDKMVSRGHCDALPLQLRLV